jgi:magnesium-transporting ATPase (P-type)
MNMEQPVRQTASEQLSYAEVLHWSILLGFIVLVVTFLAYVLGWLPSYVPLERLPQLWGLSATEYLKATGTPTGWSWLFMMNKGDFASQLGIAILSGCSIACIIAIMPAYVKAKNFAYIAICILEIAVLVLSASGILGH